MKIFLLYIGVFLFLMACGVKGKPLPPENPREIGIGKPQYKGVDEELKKTKPKKEPEE